MSDGPRPALGIQRTAPPVPRRRDSLPTPTADLKIFITKQSLETTIDDPGCMMMYEAKSLWRDSYKTLYEFYQGGQLCDVEIKAGEKSFLCHRVVLACVSRYFRTMFTSEMSESRQATVHIKDIEESAMQQLIDFAYTSKIAINTENAQCLLYASSILQVESVAHACCEFMQTHLDPSNCIGIREFAAQHGRTDLMKRADQYILDQFERVTEQEEFLTMSASHFEATLATSNLNVNSETVVFEAVMRWINFDIPGRKQYLAKLLAQVKLPLLPAAYLMGTVAKNELLMRDLECRDYLDEAKNYQLSMAQVVPELQRSERMRPRKSYAGVIFCVGGRGSSGDPFKSIECYDTRKDRWFPVADMSCRRRHVGVVSIAGKLYAVGGHDGTDHLNSGEVFDPETNKWRPIAPMSTLRRGLALAWLGGPIYAIGGLDDSACFNIVERYDVESDTWSLVQSMNMPRGGVAVATLKGYLYAVGGNDGASSLDSCERYDPYLNKWTFIATMNKRRAGAGVAELYGQLFIVGGFDDNSPLDSVERYNVEQNLWEIVTTMSCPRGGVGVTALSGRIYAVGGHDGTNYLSTVEAYDPLNDSWDRVSDISACRAGAGIVVIACRIEQLKDSSKVNLSLSGEMTQRLVRSTVVILTLVFPSPLHARPDHSDPVSGDTPAETHSPGQRLKRNNGSGELGQNVPEEHAPGQQGLGIQQAPGQQVLGLQQAPGQQVLGVQPAPGQQVLGVEQAPGQQGLGVEQDPAVHGHIPAAQGHIPHGVRGHAPGGIVAVYHSGPQVPIAASKRPILVVAPRSSQDSLGPEPGPSHRSNGHRVKGRRKRHTYYGEPSPDPVPPTYPRPRSHHDQAGPADDQVVVDGAAAAASGITYYGRIKDTPDVSISQPATPPSRSPCLSPLLMTPHSQPATPSKSRIRMGFGNLRSHLSPELRSAKKKSQRDSSNNNEDTVTTDTSPGSSPEHNVPLTSPNNNTDQQLDSNPPGSPQPSTSQAQGKASRAPLASPHEL